MSVQDFPNDLLYSAASLCEFMLLRLSFEDVLVLDAGSDGRILISEISPQEMLVQDDNA